MSSFLSAAEGENSERDTHSRHDALSSYVLVELSSIPTRYFQEFGRKIPFTIKMWIHFPVLSSTSSAAWNKTDTEYRPLLLHTDAFGESESGWHATLPKPLISQSCSGSSFHLFGDTCNMMWSFYLSAEPPPSPDVELLVRQKSLLCQSPSKICTPVHSCLCLLTGVVV